MNCVSFSCSSRHRALSENSMPLLRQRPCRARRPGRASASRLGSRRTVRRGRTPPGCGPGQDFLVVERLAGVLAAELDFLAVVLAVPAALLAEAFVALDLVAVAFVAPPALRAVAFVAPVALVAEAFVAPVALVAEAFVARVAVRAVVLAEPLAFLAVDRAVVPA